VQGGQANLISLTSPQALGRRRKALEAAGRLKYALVSSSIPEVHDGHRTMVSAVVGAVVGTVVSAMVGAVVGTVVSAMVGAGFKTVLSAGHIT
jgi:outer membrane lipoprotein SlyB